MWGSKSRRGVDLDGWEVGWKRRQREERTKGGEEKEGVRGGEGSREEEAGKLKAKSGSTPRTLSPFSETSREDFRHPRLISLSSPVDISSVFFSSLSSYQKETCSIPIPASQEVRPRKQTPALLSPSPVDSSSPSPFLLLLVDPYPLSKYKPRLG